MTGLPSPEDSVVNPQTGGSAAGRAYRAELARQGISVADATVGVSAQAQPNAALVGGNGEARAAERKKVAGRASVVFPGGAVVTGKMIDISLTGACILMEEALPSKRVCALEFDIFHAGKRYVFNTQAVSVYAVLASGKGFKIGFQFGPRGPAAQAAIAALVA
jgi:hypothetical protein